jgi:hypothetical protein
MRSVVAASEWKKSQEKNIVVGGKWRTRKQTDEVLL